MIFHPAQGGLVDAVLILTRWLEHQGTGGMGTVMLWHRKADGTLDVLATVGEDRSRGTRGVSLDRPFVAYGQSLGVTVVDSPDPGSPDPVAVGALVAGVGFLVSLLLAFIRVLGVRRDQHLERLVAARTQELADREQVYRHQFESNSSPMLLVDPQGGAIVEGNSAASVFYGYAHEELCKLRLTDLDRWPSEALASTLMQAAHGPGLRLDATHRRADGTTREVEVSTSPLVHQGRPVIHCIVTDTTERKVAERALKDAEQRWEFALEGSGDGVWDWDAVANQVFYSRRWKEMLGYSEDEVGTGLDEWDKRIHPDDRDQCYADLQRHFRGETPYYSNEHRVHHKNGSWLWILDRGKVVSWTPEGAPARVIGTHVDTTERRQAEEARREANLNLEEAVAQARDLAVRAEAANRAKGDFLANMSHEVRTPLNGILGMADLLSGTALTEDQASYVRLVQQGGQNLLDVLNDILDLSKIEAGQLTFGTAAFDPAVLLTEVSGTWESRARDKGLDFRLDLHPDLPTTLWGDPSRLRQVVVNLISNAVKFTQQGAIVVRVRPFPPAGPGGLKVLVSDTGIGIPADKLDLLFERFSQVDGSRTRAFGGAGLGLALCRQLVEMMGGEIGVETLEGQGSEFWFTARLAVDQPLADGPPDPGEPRDRRSERAKILLVEDNPVNRIVAEGLLKKLGHTCLSAADGVQGLEALSHEPFDLILMDVQMPRMDGYEAVRQIRRSEVAGVDRLVPVVALTAHAHERERDQCLAAGMSDVVTKPIDPTQLAEALERWLPPPALDLPGVRFRLQEDDELIRAVFAGFEADLPGQTQALEEALATEDWSEVGRRAHYLRGAAANVGAEALRDRASQLEAAAAAGEAPPIRDLATGLAPLFRRWQEEVLKEIKG